jgi:hypothetical protein
MMRVEKMKKERRKLALERLAERRKRREAIEEWQKRRDEARLEKKKRKEEAEMKERQAEEEARVAAQKAESKAIEEGKSKIEVIQAAAEAANEVVGQVEEQESDSGESLSDGSNGVDDMNTGGADKLNFFRNTLDPLEFVCAPRVHVVDAVTAVTQTLSAIALLLLYLTHHFICRLGSGLNYLYL